MSRRKCEELTTAPAEHIYCEFGRPGMPGHDERPIVLPRLSGGRKKKPALINLGGEKQRRLS